MKKKTPEIQSGRVEMNSSCFGLASFLRLNQDKNFHDGNQLKPLSSVKRTRQVNELIDDEKGKFDRMLFLEPRKRNF